MRRGAPMPFESETYRVLIASPSDLAEERESEQLAVQFLAGRFQTVQAQKHYASALERWCSEKSYGLVLSRLP
jgi:hypothetical protein